MANALAAKFLKELIACFPRFPVSDATKELYLRKLSNWKLSAREWDGALDRIVSEMHLKEDSIPQLSDIFKYLKSQSFATASENDYGFMCFDIGQYRYSIRVKYYNGEWVSVKTGAAPVIPIDAANIRINADNAENTRTEAA